MQSPAIQAAVAIPKHYIDETSNSRTLTLAAWTITVENHPISSASHLKELQNDVPLPLPEMTFGHNCVRLKHRPSSWEYIFSTKEALAGVRNGQPVEGDGTVKVSHADAWLKSRTDPNSETPMPDIVPTQQFDWTYTTTYSGHVSESSPPHAVFRQSGKHKIPGDDELTRPDPFLFYAQTLLFEDELHDNGSSSLLIRLRVMPTYLFLVASFRLRVDKVLFRTFETRIYHSFTESPPIVIKETTGREASFEALIKYILKQPEDTRKSLTDMNFIASSLRSYIEHLSDEERTQGAGTGWSGLEKRVEVVIPSNAASAITESMEELTLND